MGRPEADVDLKDATTFWAMGHLGNGLIAAKRFEEALSVQEAKLSTMRRLGIPEQLILDDQSNLATTYQYLGRAEQALRLRHDVYSGHLKFDGEESHVTLTAANNYAVTLACHDRFEEAKLLYRKSIPVAQRVLGKCHDLTLRLRSTYAIALRDDLAATLDDLREAVTTLEDTERIARRVLGSVHPLAVEVERDLGKARVALRAREMSPGSA